MGLVQSHLIQVLIVKTSIIVGIHAFCIVVQVLILPLSTSDIDISNPQEGEIFFGVDKNFTDLNNPSSIYTLSDEVQRKISFTPS